MADKRSIGPIELGFVDIGPLQSGFNSALTLNVNDTISLSDSGIVVLGLDFLFTDSITLSDSVLTMLDGDIMNLYVDNFTLTDSVGLILGLELNFTDSVVLSDATIDVLGIVLETSDSFVLADSIGLQLGLQLHAVEILSLSDLAVEHAPISPGILIDDSILLTDLLQKFSAGFISVQDQITLVDNMQLIMQGDFFPLSISVADSLSFVDDFILHFNSTLLRFTDTLNLQDSVKIHLTTNLNNYLRRYLNDAIGDGNP